MIKNKLGYIVSFLTIIICGVLIINNYLENKKIASDTSSTNTIRKEESVKLQETDKKIYLYVVKKGDTLWDLSVKYYGDGTKYRQIIEKNPGKTFKFQNGDEGLIYPGTELEI